MAERCFYCGREATVDDPGLPAWAVELTGLASKRVEHLVASGEPVERPHELPVDALPYGIPAHAELGETQPVDRLHESIEAQISERSELAIGDYATRSLCESCATTLEGLDSPARLLLAPMIGSRKRDYDADEQRILAAWGARQAYAVLIVEGKGEGVPPWHRQPLLARGEPHEDVFVGYGRYRRDHVGVLAARLLVPIGEDRSDVEAYSVLCVFGGMALKVFGIHRRPASTRVKPPEGEMVRVWPPHRDVVDWPPLWALDESTLDQAFLQEPFYQPFAYSEVRYLGQDKKIKAKRRRTEGPGQLSDGARGPMWSGTDFASASSATAAPTASSWSPPSGQSATPSCWAVGKTILVAPALSKRCSECRFVQSPRR
jgi:hypothetical protein